jgi:hypothetical protein
LVVAILAFLAEESRMYFWLGMTLVTRTRSTAIYEVAVAFLAIDFGMVSFQEEDTIVVKIIHPVDTIMTIETRCSILFDMDGDKVRFS